MECVKRTRARCCPLRVHGSRGVAWGRLIGHTRVVPLSFSLINAITINSSTFTLYRIRILQSRNVKIIFIQQLFKIKCNIFHIVHERNTFFLFGIVRLIDDSLCTSPWNLEHTCAGTQYTCATATNVSSLAPYEFVVRETSPIEMSHERFQGVGCL